MREFWDNSIYSLLSTWIFTWTKPETYFGWNHFHSIPLKSFGQNKFPIPSTGKKLPFWQFFRMGWNGYALLGRPSRIPHRNWNISFVFGADECAERLEAKLASAYSFMLKYSKITVCGGFRWISWPVSRLFYLSLVLLWPTHQYSLGIWLQVGVLHCQGVTMRHITEGFITPHVQTIVKVSFFHVGITHVCM